MEMRSRIERKQLEYYKRRKQRSKWLMLTCWLLMSVAVYFVWVPGWAAVSGSISDISQQDNTNMVQEVQQLILPNNYNNMTNNLMRDPFAVPKEFQPVTTPVSRQQPNAAGLAPGVTSPKTPDIQLILVGIVSGGGNNVAIIKSAGNSRSYQIEDYVGTYQLVAVEKKSVTLQGPQGRKVLTLER